MDILSKFPLEEPVVLLVSEAATQHKAALDTEREEKHRERELRQRRAVDAVSPANTLAYQPGRGRGAMSSERSD